MNTNIRIRLSALMFLQYFAWGTWYVTLGTYLSTIGFNGLDIGDVFSASAWAALFSPIFVGMIADRYFSAQKLLSLLYICSGFGLFWTSTQTDPIDFSLHFLLRWPATCRRFLCQMRCVFIKCPIRVFCSRKFVCLGLLVGLLRVS